MLSCSSGAVMSVTVILKSMLYYSQVNDENAYSVQETQHSIEDFVNKQPHFCT